MVSGKTILLAVLALVLVGFVAAVSVWRVNIDEGHRRAAAESTARYEQIIDWLRLKVDSLRSHSPGSDQTGEFYELSRLAQDELRHQVNRMVWLACSLSGTDTINFLIERLGDTTFYSHYGHYDEPRRLWIAPEELGLRGIESIRTLIRHLDSAQGFELEQIFYALRLASQHPTVVSIAGRASAPDQTVEQNPAEARAAWKRWANKWGLE